MQRVAVIGLGYVGFPLAELAAEKGYAVFGIDINKEKIESLRATMQQRKKDKKEAGAIQLDTSFKPVADADVVIVCVPTPVLDDYQPDLRPLQSAVEMMGPYIKKGQLVLIESTINPGVCEEVVLPTILEKSHLSEGDFFFAHCPERINPGDPKWHVGNIPRVVGGIDKKSLDLAVSFYSSLIDAEIKPMGSLREAEAVKMVENAFRDINIAFVNELAMSFSVLGIDVVNVLDGAATKPFSFMRHTPGCGVGGHCIPVDPYYLMTYAKKNGFTHHFLAMARTVNNGMPEFTVGLLTHHLDELSIPHPARVAVLGIAYKPDIDDVRESPSTEIIEHLEGSGHHVASFDPHVPAQSSAKSLDEALEGADAVILATAHTEFVKKVTPALLKRHGVRILIDGRNAFDKDTFVQAGITYRGIGR